MKWCRYIILFIIIIKPGCLRSQLYNFGHIDYRQNLSHNHIICFAEDNNGFIWVGTHSGLNRFDGYEFKTFLHNPSDSNSLPENTVESIVKDQLGRFWISVPNEMCLFNPSNEQFSFDFQFTINNQKVGLYNISSVFPYGDSTLLLTISGLGIIKHNLYNNQNQLIDTFKYDTLSISANNVSSISENQGKLYVTYFNGIIDVFNPQTRKVEERILKLNQFTGGVRHNYECFIDNENNLWFYSNWEDIGIIKLSAQGAIDTYNTNTTPSLNSNLISGIIQSEKDMLWIGTDHGGINILNTKTNTIDYLIHEPTNENSLSQNVITSFFQSSDSTIWAGTFKKGVNFYHKNLFRFYLYANHPGIDNSLVYNDVNCFAEDKNGNIWIGTNGEGLIFFNRKQNSFRKIPTQFNESNKLESDVIVSLHFDKSGLLWIGTYHGGLASFDGNKYTNYLHSQDPRSIADNRVWEVFEDSGGNLWVGMLGGGIDLFNKEKNEFNHYSGTGIHSMNTNFVMDITEDLNGNVWFATDFGLYVLDHKTSRFIQYATDQNDNSTLSNNFVYKVYCDSKNRIWAGTRDGLNLFDRSTNSFIRFNKTNGLGDNSIMAILESEQGNIWLSTSQGLSKLVVKYDTIGKYLDHYVVNFNESDGLQGKEFNEGSALKTSNNELIFGGSNGFNLFKPTSFPKVQNKYITHILGLELFGQSASKSIRDENAKYLHSAILDGSTIKLRYIDNMFSLKFVALDYLESKKLKYRYKLDGFNKTWIYSDWEDRKATYTNLNPGKYTFRVQASDDLTNWENSEAYLNIVIQPPWYLTPLAFITYVLIILLLFLIFRRILLINERNKYREEQAIKESERQQELNALKTRFFTNVSHEFRTPLTLILTPLEKILKGNVSSENRKHLELMLQNTKRLLQLVNQLLDFRKAEENKLRLNLIYGNIIGLFSQTISAFSDFRETKNIELEFLPDEKELFMQFDKDKIEKILSNLLSNAFKFTPEKGSIKVITHVYEQNQKEVLQLIVKDSGIGISMEDQQRIFDRFYQSELPNNFITRGSGVGLSLTKDFIELHGGTIGVESQPGKGSKFIVELPVNSEKLEQKEETKNVEIVPEIQDEISKKDVKSPPKDKTILLVEDNPDFRYYLKDSLSDTYNILEADNGKVALELIDKKQPDLIVSDVMMPEMDGLELCNTIKTSTDYSHIPIILLTAKSTQQDKIEGLNQGADEYISKPFSLEILESRINYLLNLRKKFIKHYQKSFDVKFEDDIITPLDEKLLNKTLELIKLNMSISEFNVEKLSKELGMSRVNLYKKLTSLTGKTPVEFIRYVRLRRAAELLVKSQLTVSEITYEVGFTDPRYFSKQFKAEFNVLPSKYKDEGGNLN